ncbi:MAG: family 10 glycosylhydrolase [Candidatus Tantalella remota]|nr:family 10 glycosylhydrolase [Candidatus Tantalella remota]
MQKSKRFFITCILILSFFVSLSCQAQPADKTTSPRLGVWITVFSPEEVLYSTESIDRLIETCKSTGVNDIYIQVYRAGKAYYDSDIADSTPYKKMVASCGRDPVKYLIRKATMNDISLHAWINVLSVSQNKNADIIKKLGKGVITVDQHGRSAFADKNPDDLDGYYIREKQIFLEPGDKRVRDYFGSITEELIKKYPRLAGLHLDYIRYPRVVPFVPGSRFNSHGISYGYGEKNVSSFKAKTGLDVKKMGNSRENFQKWDNWRREQVTATVRELSEKARGLAPSLKISCTIIASADMTYLTTFQDWTLWIKEGYINYVVAMDYTDDPRLFDINALSLMMPDVKDKVQIGVGAYLLKDRPELFREELEISAKIDPPGIVIFSYDDIAADKQIRDAVIDVLGPAKD